VHGAKRCTIAAGSVWGAFRSAGADAWMIGLPVCFLLHEFIIPLRSRERKRFLVAILHKVPARFLVDLQNSPRKGDFYGELWTDRLL